MKHIILIGASGFVGNAILQEALNRGIHVTAVMRDPAKISVKNELLKIVKADVSVNDELAEIAHGTDAVVSAYNPGWTNPDIYNLTLKVYPAIVEGVKKAGVKRLLMVGGAGTLFVAPDKRVVDTGVIPDEILPGVKGLGEFYLNILMKEKAIDWVFFSPAAQLVEGKYTGVFRLGKDDLIVDEKGNSTISVQDYAAAMIDELEHPKHHQERFTIGY